MAEFKYFLDLNILVRCKYMFPFLGNMLNSLVIISFWWSLKLQKKLCHFMIMILSSCDLLVVLTNHPLMVYIACDNVVEREFVRKFSVTFIQHINCLHWPFITGSFGDFGDKFWSMLVPKIGINYLWLV